VRDPSPCEFALKGGPPWVGGVVAHGDDIALPVVGGGVRGGRQRSGGPTGELSYLREADDVLVGLLTLLPSFCLLRRLDSAEVSRRRRNRLQFLTALSQVAGFALGALVHYVAPGRLRRAEGPALHAACL
jgi:hypothetical protein